MSGEQTKIAPIFQSARSGQHLNGENFIAQTIVCRPYRRQKFRHQKLIFLFGNVNIFVPVDPSEREKPAENYRQNDKDHADNQRIRACISSRLKRIQKIYRYNRRNRSQKRKQHILHKNHLRYSKYKKVKTSEVRTKFGN